ncbi:hypothetical protein B0H12DRAFT_485247 [Mycena haematopus]|nr:hypothetical protein B0H12DRAFT_485247 [Mycena haematopus]
MRFSTFVLFASTFASALSAPAPRNDSSSYIDSLVSQTSVVIVRLTRLNGLGARIIANYSIRSTPGIDAAMDLIDDIVDRLIPVRSDDLLSGLLDDFLGGGGGLGQILNGNGVLLSGLFSDDLLGSLLGSDGLLGSLLGGLLGGDGGLLGGLLGGDGGGLLGGLLGGRDGDGGLLGGLLGRRDGGLAESVAGMLDLFPALNSSCGTDIVSELLEAVQGLVETLTGLLPDAQQCACGGSRTLKANVAALIKANIDQLVPTRT